MAKLGSQNGVTLAGPITEKFGTRDHVAYVLSCAK